MSDFNISFNLFGKFYFSEFTVSQSHVTAHLTSHSIHLASQPSYFRHAAANTYNQYVIRNHTGKAIFILSHPQFAAGIEYEQMKIGSEGFKCNVSNPICNDGMQ